MALQGRDGDDHTTHPGCHVWCSEAEHPKGRWWTGGGDVGGGDVGGGGGGEDKEVKCCKVKKVLVAIVEMVRAILEMLTIES